MTALPTGEPLVRVSPFKRPAPTDEMDGISSVVALRSVTPEIATCSVPLPAGSMWRIRSDGLLMSPSCEPSMIVVAEPAPWRARSSVTSRSPVAAMFSAAPLMARPYVPAGSTIVSAPGAALAAMIAPRRLQSFGAASMHAVALAVSSKRSTWKVAARAAAARARATQARARNRMGRACEPRGSTDETRTGGASVDSPGPLCYGPGAAHGIGLAGGPAAPLSDRRQRVRLPRVPRHPEPGDVTRAADQRRLWLHQHDRQAPPRGAAAAPGRGLRPAGRDFPRPALRRLQGDAGAGARRAPPADRLRAEGRRGAPPAGGGGPRGRGRRRDRHARPPGQPRRLRDRARHRRQGPDAARGRADHVVRHHARPPLRPGRGARALRCRAGAGGRRARADG